MSAPSKIRALPEASREFLFTQTDTTYRGPHNICSREDEPYRFLGLNWLTWPVMALIAGAGWLASLPL